MERKLAIIKSKINTNSKSYLSNKESYNHLIKIYDKKIKNSFGPNSTTDKEKVQKANKLLAWERIEALVDPGSPILNIAQLAGDNVYQDVPPGAGVLACVAEVAKRKCLIVANNPLVKGGAYFPLTVKKHLRAQEIAKENKLTCIYLVDSGGAFLPKQAEIFPDQFHFGRIFYNQAQMSAEGIAQISVVLGSCTAGGAYVPAMSEQTIMVEGQSSIFLGGPPLVKAATGEEVTAEELGGAKVHTEISGVADYLAKSEIHALSIARSCIASLGEDKTIRPIRDTNPETPLYNPFELYGILGDSLRKKFSILEVIARIVDGSRFDEFKENYGETIKCGFSHIDGYRIGIIANDGILFSESALKATHFIELCERRNIPLLFIHNISGFMVGKEYEHKGIAKHGAKLVTAVATSSVPKISLIVGGSFGAGNYAMCGRAYQPRFIFSWPNSRISVMGGEQAANVLAQIKTDSAKRKKEKINKIEIEKLKETTIKKYEDEGNAFYASSQIWDDGVINPIYTREVLSLALSSIYLTSGKSNFGLFRM